MFVSPSFDFNWVISAISGLFTKALSVTLDTSLLHSQENLVSEEAEFLIQGRSKNVNSWINTTRLYFSNINLSRYYKDRIFFFHFSPCWYFYHEISQPIYNLVLARSSIFLLRQINIVPVSINFTVLYIGNSPKLYFKYCKYFEILLRRPNRIFFFVAHKLSDKSILHLYWGDEHDNCYRI